MSLRTVRRTALAGVAMVGTAILIGVILFRYWISPLAEQRVEKAKPPGLVDDRPLLTAQRLAAMAATPEEQEFATNAMRLSDHEVDLAFAAALHQATEHAPPVPAAARPILAKVQETQRRVNAEQQGVARLKQLLAQANDSSKPALQDRLDLTQATLEVDQEDLDALHQELIRAGGDPRARVQELKDQHEASNHSEAGVAPGSAPKAGAAQEGQSRILVVQVRAWHELAGKENALTAAREEASHLAAELAQDRKKLDEETREESSAAAAAAQPAVPGSQSTQSFSALQHAAGERRHLADLDKRMEDLKQLDGVYKDWAALVSDRKHQYWLGVVEGTCWVLVLLLVLLLANRLVHGVISAFAPESRRRHTIRIALRFAVQVIALVLILVVVFGPPSQIATVLALAGAGLTVALKDFIVGFFGWFILMGPNGIRPGDWVQINDISGEVVEVGLLHTVILETGDWSDAGHPTGRKVTVVNSFAIEGHYFNFSTTGQWLWEQIEVPIPSGVDPYPIAEAVHEMVLAETRDDVQLAEQEWQRAIPSHVGKTFSPGPAIMVRPTTLGVNVVVRYITRAHKRHEVRSRLFNRVVELLRSKHIASAPLARQVEAGTD